jgi:hypothetical protein
MNLVRLWDVDEPQAAGSPDRNRRHQEGRNAGKEDKREIGAYQHKFALDGAATLGVLRRARPTNPSRPGFPRRVQSPGERIKPPDAGL